MHHQIWFWEKMAESPLGLMFLGLIIIFFQKSGLYNRWQGSQIRYAKPMQQRIGLLVLAASFLWLTSYCRPIEWYWPMYVIMVILSLGVVFLSGPSELTVNLDRRTYLAKFGWPLLPKKWSGPLNDIAKLDVISAEGTCRLIVRWKQKQVGIVIGSFGSRAKAEAAAAQVAKLLEIDVPIGTAARTGQIYRNQ